MAVKYNLDGKKCDIWATRLFMSAIIFKGANLTFQCTEILPEIIEKIMLLIIISLYVYFFAINILIKIKRNQNIILILAIAFTLMYFWAYIKYPSIQMNIIKRFIWTVIFGIPCFACLYDLNDIDIFYRTIYKYSFIITIFGTLIYFGDTGPLSSNMSFSSMMLFPLCLHITGLDLFSKKVPLLIICIYEFMIIFIHGSRGGLLYIVLFFILYFGLKKHNYLKMSKVAVIFLGIASIIIAFAVLNINTILKQLSSKGIYIRNIDFLASGQFLSENGRTKIYLEYMQLVLENAPITLRIVDLKNHDTNYPHNIFIEVLYNYGYFLGLLIIAIFLIVLVKRLLSSKEIELKIVMVLLSAGFFPLLTSFTYFEWPIFWAFIGCLSKNVRCFRRQKST